MRVGSVDGHSKTEFEANSRSLDCVPRPRFARECQNARDSGGSGLVVRDMNKAMRVADYAMRFIAGLGVKHVFVLTGGGALHLNDALARCPDLEFVCNHPEQA